MFANVHLGREALSGGWQIAEFVEGAGAVTTPAAHHAVVFGETEFIGSQVEVLRDTAFDELGCPSRTPCSGSAGRRARRDRRGGGVDHVEGGVNDVGVLLGEPEPHDQRRDGASVKVSRVASTAVCSWYPKNDSFT